MSTPIQTTTITIHFRFWQAVRLLFGARLSLTLAHGVPMYKAIVGIGGEEIKVNWYEG